MTDPQTRRRTFGAVAGMLLALLGHGITVYDADARGGSGPTSSDTTVSAPTEGEAFGPAALLVPDPTLHPGAIDPDLDAATICAQGFTTRSIRPSTSYTNRLKTLELGDGGSIKGPSGTTYVIVGEHLPGSPGDYELDHLIPLTLGGNPEDPENLWMQPWEKKGARLAPPGEGAESKDVVESRLHREVCKGTLDLDVAQQTIASDWTRAR